MRILIVTDAWQPQVNGVVTTLVELVRHLQGVGHSVTVVHSGQFRTRPCPGYAGIDLALTRGIPSFLDTLQVVLAEMAVEQAIIAEEMITVSPDLYEALVALLGDIPIQTISHEAFKVQSGVARAVIRTGEYTPYANVILCSGVVF